MNRKEDSIREIVALEYRMFQAVENEGGRADCQDDWTTFSIMRSSQFAMWDEETCDSYLEDLHEAVREKRNMVMEKYAYMMEVTDPDGFARIRSRIRLPSELIKRKAMEINQLMVRCTEEYAEQYPYLSGRGRAVHQAESVGRNTSVEIYQIGELYTYSIRTLTLLHAHLNRLKKDKRNSVIEIMETTVRKYGYASVKDAEKSLKRPGRGEGAGSVFRSALRASEH